MPSVSGSGNATNNKMRRIMIVLVRELKTGTIKPFRCEDANSHSGSNIALYSREQISPHGYLYHTKYLPHAEYSFIGIVKTSTSE